MPPKFLAVRNLGKHQTVGPGGGEWVKDWLGQLTDPRYIVDLTWAQMGLLSVIRKAAVTVRNRFPADARTLSMVLRKQVDSADLDALIERRFLIDADSDEAAADLDLWLGRLSATERKRRQRSRDRDRRDAVGQNVTNVTNVTGHKCHEEEKRGEENQTHVASGDATRVRKAGKGRKGFPRDRRKIRATDIPAYTLDFEKLWTTYPARNGRRRAKPGAYAAFLDSDLSRDPGAFSVALRAAEGLSRWAAGQDDPVGIADLCGWIDSAGWQDDLGVEAPQDRGICPRCGDTPRTLHRDEHRWDSTGQFWCQRHHPPQEARK